MREFKLIVVRLLVIMAVMLPWAATEALETFEQAGVITHVDYELFTINNKEYRVSSAELDSNNLGRNKISDLRVGDLVWLRGKVLNDVNYVDFIVYMKPANS